MAPQTPLPQSLKFFSRGSRGLLAPPSPAPLHGLGGGRGGRAGPLALALLPQFQERKVPMTAIKFGTSGWRGVLAEDFTFANARLVCQAIADYLKDEGIASQGVVIGYDTRFRSEAFAATAAEVLAGNGIHSYFTNRDCPTPVVSFAIGRASGPAASTSPPPTTRRNTTALSSPRPPAAQPRKRSPGPSRPGPISWAPGTLNSCPWSRPGARAS